ncbi:MAG: hypothetical protein AAGG38_14545 [Planctomycetota bacterium]
MTTRSQHAGSLIVQRFIKIRTTLGLGLAALALCQAVSPVFAGDFPGPILYTYDQPDPASLDGVTGEAIVNADSTIESVLAQWRPDQNTFVFDVTFLSGDVNPDRHYFTPESTLPTGFSLVVNNGPEPKMHVGELAVLYFEAEDLLTGGPDAPTLSAYAYNGANSATSYRFSDFRDESSEPDFIASSRSTLNPLTLASVVEDTPQGDRIERRFRIEVDATPIVNHTPSQDPFSYNPDDRGPLTWTGIGFDYGVGIWFHPFNDINPEYYESSEFGDLEGALTTGEDGNGWSVVRKNHGFFDISDQLAVATPIPEPAVALIALAGLPLLTRRRTR